MTDPPPGKILDSMMVALMSLCAFIGCKTDSPLPYVSPRVTGCLLDSQSHRPIAGVLVQRLLPGQDFDGEVAAHGGEMLQQPPPAWTGTNGTFLLEAKRDLLGRHGWYRVRISYSRAGYVTLVTNYTMANAALSSNGLPVVSAGDILLPASR